jgi:hypothetical protein
MASPAYTLDDIINGWKKSRKESIFDAIGFLLAIYSRKEFENNPRNDISKISFYSIETKIKEFEVFHIDKGNLRSEVFFYEDQLINKKGIQIYDSLRINSLFECACKYLYEDVLSPSRNITADGIKFYYKCNEKYYKFYMNKTGITSLISIVLNELEILQKRYKELEIKVDLLNKWLKSYDDMTNLAKGMSYWFAIGNYYLKDNIKEVITVSVTTEWSHDTRNHFDYEIDLSEDFYSVLTKKLYPGELQRALENLSRQGSKVKTE